MNEEAADSEVGLTLQEGVHLFKWKGGRKLSGHQNLQEGLYQSKWSTAHSRFAASLTGLLDLCLVFTVIHTSTLRMIYIHNQVLFEQKKSVLNAFRLNIKVFIGITSLSLAYWLQQQWPRRFSSPKSVLKSGVCSLMCFSESLSGAVKACQCTVCRGWRWRCWIGHIYRGRRTQPLRWGRDIQAAARTRPSRGLRGQWWPVSRLQRWLGPGWDTPLASSSPPALAPAWGCSFWRAAKWQFWRVSALTGCARRGWPLWARPARRSDRASVVFLWHWCLASVFSALWFSYLLLLSPRPPSARRSEGPCHTCRHCHRRGSALRRCSPPPRSCWRSHRTWRTKIPSADPVAPLYLLPDRPAESGLDRSGRSSWSVTGGLWLAFQCRPIWKGPFFSWTRRSEFCEKCPLRRRSSSSSGP